MLAADVLGTGPLKYPCHGLVRVASGATGARAFTSKTQGRVAAPDSPARADERVHALVASDQSRRRAETARRDVDAGAIAMRDQRTNLGGGATANPPANAGATASDASAVDVAPLAA